ncbi:MAG: hypothetical protein WCW36_00010 [Candidatus Paceibacterota bacterium]|jgi:hypothetical protein
MKRFAGSRYTGKEPIVVPVVVVAIAIHVPLVVPAVEREVAMCGVPSISLPIEALCDLRVVCGGSAVFGIIMPEHFTPSIFIF